MIAQKVKQLPAVQETRVQSLGQEDSLEKEVATHSSTLAWKITWMEEPGRLQSMGSHLIISLQNPFMATNQRLIDTCHMANIPNGAPFSLTPTPPSKQNTLPNLLLLNLLEVFSYSCSKQGGANRVHSWNLSGSGQCFIFWFINSRVRKKEIWEI